MAAWSACRARGEGRLEGIPDNLEHNPAMGFDCLAQDSVVDLQRSRHLVGVLLPQWRAADDIAK